MFCKKCGKEIKDTWVKCPYCGTEATKEEETKENGRKDEPKPQPITGIENVNVPQKDSDSFNATNGNNNKKGGCFTRIAKILIKIIVVFLVIIGPFTGTEFGTTKDYVLEVIKYYVSLLLIVGPGIALVCNIRGIRDKLPLFKKHKLFSTILASFIVYLLIGIVGMVAYSAIDTFHTEQYYEEYKADQEAKEKAKLEEEKAKKEAEEKAKEEQAKKEAEEKAKEEQAKKETEEKAKEEQAKKETEEKAKNEIENQSSVITGDIIQDAKNGLLYVKDGKITDHQGNVLEQYSDYHINNNGGISTEYYVVEGLEVEQDKIIYKEPEEVEYMMPGEIALSRLESATDADDARNLIRNHYDYNGKLVKVSGTVHESEGMWYLSTGDGLNNWLVLEDIRCFDEEGSGTQMMDGDYIHVTGIFYYNTGYLDLYGTTLHSLTDAYAVLDGFWN